MGADEEGTITRQKTHRSELIDPAIAEHDGRIVKTTGDGLLVDFPRVVDAVRCAVVIQQAMVEREADLPEERRIRYRVGINLGDIASREHRARPASQDFHLRPRPISLAILLRKAA